MAMRTEADCEKVMRPFWNGSTMLSICRILSRGRLRGSTRTRVTKSSSEITPGTYRSGTGGNRRESGGDMIRAIAGGGDDPPPCMRKATDRHQGQTPETNIRGRHHIADTKHTFSFFGMPELRQISSKTSRKSSRNRTWPSSW